MDFRDRTFAILFLLAGLSGTVSARSTPPDRSRVPSTQAHGSWVDPDTGLMWAGKDNGKAVNWQTAKRYCRDLRLGDYADWRLPTIEELQTIDDRRAEAPGINPSSRWHGAETVSYHVKGNLFLTGDEWSVSQRDDDRGHPTARVWYFDFLNNARKDDDTTHVINLWGGIANSLCVRRPRQVAGN